MKLKSKLGKISAISTISIPKSKLPVPTVNLDSKYKNSKPTEKEILRIYLSDWLKFTNPLRHRILSLATL